VEEESHVSHLDEFFDLVFVVTLAHIGVKFRIDEDWSSLISLFAHWLPMYYNWFVFEGFLNRFSSTVKWVYFLYLAAFIGVIGVAVNVQGCGLSSFTLADIPYPCFDFALFIFCGRMACVIAWIIAALGVHIGRAYCWWRVLAAAIPAFFYFGAMWTMNQWLTMPVLWFVGIGLDIVLHVVPSTIVWGAEYIPRHTHFTEGIHGCLCFSCFSCSKKERHAMMYIVALGECVIAAGIPINYELPVGRTVGARYGVMFSVTILSFFLCVQNFVASDTAKLEHHGGTHGLHVSRFSRCVWLFCQFIAVSAMVIAGAICKNITKKLELSQFFRYWFGVSVAVIVLASAVAQLVHVYPPGDKRTCSRPVRFIVRSACGIIVFGLSFVPVDLFGEPGWIAVVAAVVTVFTIAEVSE
jgi:low temperature requirement protein LtrA